MKPVNVNSTAHIDFNKENNKVDPKFKVGYHVRISKYENSFAKSYVSNWSEVDFMIKKVKNAVPWTYVIEDLMGKEIVEGFAKKNCKK